MSSSELGQELRRLAGSAIVDLIEIPGEIDQIVKRSLIQSTLETTLDRTDVSTYVLQIRARPELPQSAPQKPQALAAESIYLPDGGLNVPFLTRQGEVLYQSGEYRSAYTVFKTILGAGQQSAMALYWMGRCAEGEGELERAAGHYEDSIAFQPSVESYRRLALALDRLGKHLHAAECLERALVGKQLSTRDRIVLAMACGNAYAKAGRLELAERHYQQALALDPDHASILANAGQVMLELGRVDEAQDRFMRAIRLNPKDAKALTGLATCRLQSKDWRGAHDFYARSLELELTQADAMCQLVRCAFELKHYTVAARLLALYIDSAPVNPSMLFSLAGLHFHLGRLGDARQVVRRILEMEPGYQPARELEQAIERVLAG